jgi:hypothetical protein
VTRGRYAVIRLEPVGSESEEAWGPFSSLALAERFAEEYSEWANPGYAYAAVELYPVREGLRQIREEKEHDE